MSFVWIEGLFLIFTEQVGARGKEGEEEGRRRREGEVEAGRSALADSRGPLADSPIPEGFAIPDLMDLVDRLEVGNKKKMSKFRIKKVDGLRSSKTHFAQVDKESEPGSQRKVTRAIKFLCNSEESLRFNF